MNTVRGNMSKTSGPRPDKIFLGVIFTLVVFLAGYFANTFLPPQLRSNVVVSRSATVNSSLISEINSLLQQYYISAELPSTSEFWQGAAKGYLSALNDRYTTYYTAAEWADLQQENSGTFTGVGIKLIRNEGYIQVETPIVGGPAANAGVMANDLIIAVDGETMIGKSIGEVARKIRGEEGSQVVLEVVRPGEAEDFKFTLTRATIDVDSVEYNRLDDGGYQIIISKFTESDLTEFYRQWNDAVRDIGNNPKYIVLDLRNNTGGWVVAAKHVLEEFLPSQTTIFQEQDRNGNITKTFSQRNGNWQEVPVVVLVNSGSASASEIVAGAMQDLDRAELVGKNTLGKGVEQTIQRTSDGGALFIVFKKWLTPNGRNLDLNNALVPDHFVDMTSQDIVARRDPQLSKALEVITSK